MLIVEIIQYIISMTISHEKSNGGNHYILKTKNIKGILLKEKRTKTLALKRIISLRVILEFLSASTYLHDLKALSTSSSPVFGSTDG